MTKQSLKRRMRLYMIVVSLIMVIFAFAGVGCRKAKPTLTSVEVQTAPTKTEYIVGDTLSAEGGILKLNYSDGTSATENMTDSMLSADMSAAGEVTVTVSYSAGGGTPLTTTFTVTVSDPASVEVTLKSVKVNVGKDTYFQGDAFDLSDYTLTLTMSDNSTQTVALLAEHLTNQPDMTLIGEEQRINISYTYKGVAGTAYFHIIVKTDAVRSIELKTQPTLEYKECDMFEIGSAALNVTYDSGNKGEVAVTADMLDLSKVDMSVAGTYTATLTYQGKSLDLTVKVTARDFFTGIAADLSVPADITVYIPANVTALKLGGKAVDSANYSWASNVLTVKKEAFANYTNSGALVLTATTADKEYDVRLTLADKIIKQASDFAYINEHLDGYYVLGNDIDMSTLTDFAGIGTVVIDLRPGTTEADEDYIPQVGQGKTFTGTFDGMGYALKNWTFGCTELDEQDHKIYSKYQGISLFNNIGKSGVVRNVAIENFSLDLGKHNSLVATINEGLIENVIVKSGELTSWYTHGAAIAAINEGTVRNSINLVTKYTSMGNAVDLPMIAESQNGKTENLYNLAIGDKAFSKTETQLKTAETYALPASAWQIVDGIYPMLVSAKYISMQATLAEGYNLIEGLDLDTAKITVKGILVSGAEVTIEDAVFFGFDKTLADKQTITVVADGVICELEVDVYAKSVASIAWATEPNKTFTQGATFDNAASAKITVNYNNNTSDVVNVTADMVDSSAVDMNTAGDYTVKVSYGGKELTYTVSVKDSSVVVTELTLAAGLDTNAKYYAGETIDFSNVTLTVTYSDGTEDTVKVTNNVSYTDEVGEQVVTYSYGGKTVTQTITVLATPTAVTYTLNTLTEGEKFTYNTADGFAWFTNGSFTATYKNGGEKPDTTATLTADNTTVAGTLTSGKNVTVTLTVAVDEKHSFEVEVTFGLLYREIKTAADLQDVHNNLAGAYVLANDIDMSGEEDFNTIGVAAIHEYGDDNKQLVINDEAANWQTATDRKGVPFTGIFDGNGYSIKNLTTIAIGGLWQPDNYANTLFGFIGEGAIVKNFTLDHATMTGTRMAFIAGANAGLIENVTIKSNCRLNNQWQDPYAFVVVNAGTVKDCICEVEKGTKSDAEAAIVLCNKQEEGSVFENCHLATELKTISVAADTNSYIEGLGFDLSKITLSGTTYGGGTIADLKAESYTAPEGFNASAMAKGTYTLTLKYGTITVELTITVAEKSVASIEVTAPSKTNYNLGDTLDLTGGKVTVVYNNGTKGEPVDLTADMLGTYSMDTAGPVEITVTYQEKTATFTITVIDGSKEVKSVTQTGALARTQFLVGGTVEGKHLGTLKFVVTYTDNSTAEIPAAISMLSSATIAAGQTALTFTVLEGQTQTVAITVFDSISAITATVTNQKVAYKQGTTPNALSNVAFKIGDVTFESALVEDLEITMSTPENAYGSNSVTFTVNGVTSNAVTLDFYYAVSTVADWNAMNDNRSAWYMLVNDLSFADGGFAPIADTGVKYFVEDDGYYIDETVALRSTTYFSGVFDGNGYTISDIRYGATGPQEPNTAFGLFTAISGTVRNFTVTNVHFISRNLSGIVSSYNIGTIENVVVHDCSLVNNYGFGAIIVRDNEGTLKNAIAYNVTMYASSLTNAQRTAVACLYHWGSALEHVYLSNIQVGVSVWDEITSGTEESYTSDKIYNDGAAESISDTGFKTEAEIKAATSYDGWDSTVWNIVDGEIPTLKHN